MSHFSALTHYLIKAYCQLVTEQNKTQHSQEKLSAHLLILALQHVFYVKNHLKGGKMVCHSQQRIPTGKAFCFHFDSKISGWWDFWFDYLTHCSWKPQRDGLKDAETSSMDFYTQLVTLKGWKKQLENLWADIWEKRKIWFRKSKSKFHHNSKISHGIFDLLVLGFKVN